MSVYLGTVSAVIPEQCSTLFVGTLYSTHSVLPLKRSEFTNIKLFTFILQHCQQLDLHSSVCNVYSCIQETFRMFLCVKCCGWVVCCLATKLWNVVWVGWGDNGVLHWGAKVTDKQTSKLGLVLLHLGNQLFLQLPNYWFKIILRGYAGNHLALFSGLPITYLIWFCWHLPLLCGWYRTQDQSHSFKQDTCSRLHNKIPPLPPPPPPPPL